MKALNIKWETDGYCPELPEEVEIPDNVDEDCVADYLSDTYGWLVETFDIAES